MRNAGQHARVRSGYRPTSATRALAGPGCGRSDSQANPVWLAALYAAGCVAEGLRLTELVAWSFDGAQALYANSSSDTVVVSPLNMRVEPGQSLAVSWERGATSYSLRPSVWEPGSAGREIWTSDEAA